MSNPTTEKSDIGVSSGFGELAAGRPLHPTRRARIGFIGVGWWATTNHMPMLRARPDVEMAAACGLDPAVLERIKQDFGFQFVTSDVSALLKQKLDGVIVASPHPKHAEHAIAAIEAGCHVLVEKPMTTNIEEARALIDAARRHDRIVVVSYGWHHRPLCVKAKQALDRRTIGEIQHATVHMGSPAWNLFSGKSFDYGDTAYTAPDIGTYSDPEKSQGGYGQGQLSHAAGLLLWLTGLRAERIYAEMNQADARVDMHDAIVVRFGNGATGTFSGTAGVPNSARFQLDMRFFGSEGVLNLDIDRERCDVYRHDGKHEIFEVARDDGAYRCDGPPHEFVELVLGLTKQNSSPGEIGLRAVELIDAAYRSQRAGQPVSIAH